MSAAARRTDWLILSPFVAAAVILGHGIGYAAAGSLHGHGYQANLVPFLTVAGGLAFTASAHRHVRNTGTPLPTARMLSAVNLAAYVALELIEAAWAGDLAMMVSLPVVLGALAQLPVAFAAVALLRSAVRILSSRPTPLSVAISIHLPAPVAATTTYRTPPGAPAYRRGPPALR